MKFGCPFFQNAFRCFFFFGPLHVLVSLNIWVLLMMGYNVPLPLISPLWHSHEMFYGYTTAVVSGFLLTAISNWTGQKPLSGIRLATLLTVWLAGRVLFLKDIFHSFWVISFVDLLFWPMLIFYCAYPILKTKNKRNYVVLFLLALMFIANILFHLEFNGILNSARFGQSLFLNAMLSLILLISNRVVPFFASKAITDFAPKNTGYVDKILICMLAIYAVIDPFYAATSIHRLLALVLAVLGMVKLKSWYHPLIWRKPILGMLYLAYLAVFLSFALVAMEGIPFDISHLAALHCATVGGIGIFTISMMGRVSLGHTGRAIKSSPVMIASYGFMISAALLRVLGPILYPVWHLHYVHYAAGFWGLTMLLFLYEFSPMFFKARP